MYMYIYLYTYICVFIHIFIYVDMFMYNYIGMYIYRFMYMCARGCINFFICTDKYICIHLDICIHIYMYTDMDIYIYIFICICTDPVEVFNASLGGQQLLACCSELFPLRRVVECRCIMQQTSELGWGRWQRCCTRALTLPTNVIM